MDGTEDARKIGTAGVDTNPAERGTACRKKAD